MTAVTIHLSYSTPKRVLAYVGMRFLNGIWQSGGKRREWRAASCIVLISKV